MTRQKPPNLTEKKDAEIDQWILNHPFATARPLGREVCMTSMGCPLDMSSRRREKA
jgi:hypothetical protein